MAGKNPFAKAPAKGLKPGAGKKPMPFGKTGAKAPLFGKKPVNK